MSEEELINKLRYCFYDEGAIIKVGKDPNVTPKVLIEAIDRNASNQLLLAVLESPALTKEVFEMAFSIYVRRGRDFSTIGDMIISNSFFTQEMYNRLICWFRWYFQ